MRKYSSGFALLESILIFIIVAILAGTVYFVYKSNQNTSDSLKNIGTGEVTATKKTETLPAPVAEPDSITIKEWGVKINAKNADKITYTYDNKPSTAKNGDYDSAVTVSIKTGVVKNPDCQALGIYFYRSAQKASYSNKVGNYYYWAEQSAPAPCTDNPSTNPDEQLKQKISSGIDLDNIEAAPAQ